MLICFMSAHLISHCTLPRGVRLAGVGLVRLRLLADTGGATGSARPVSKSLLTMAVLQYSANSCAID